VYDFCVDGRIVGGRCHIGAMERVRTNSKCEPCQHYRHDPGDERTLRIADHAHRHRPNHASHKTVPQMAPTAVHIANG